QNRWWLGFGYSVGLGLCRGGCVVVAWVWVFGGFGSSPWWVRGGGLGLGIRWVWVFAVVGAWWWLGFGYSVGSSPWWVRGGGLGGCVVVAWVWVFGGFGSSPWWVSGGGRLHLCLGLCGGAWWCLGFGYLVGLGLAVVGAWWWWVLVVVSRYLGRVCRVGCVWWCGWFADLGGLGLCGGGFGSLPRWWVC
ncbi:hypothetical protein FCV25MIE_15407, partial [Fagus crenata]